MVKHCSIYTPENTPQSRGTSYGTLSNLYESLKNYNENEKPIPKCCTLYNCVCMCVCMYIYIYIYICIYIYTCTHIYKHSWNDNYRNGEQISGCQGLKMDMVVTRNCCKRIVHGILWWQKYKTNSSVFLNMMVGMWAYFMNETA
jgi:hypothetical protein